MPQRDGTHDTQLIEAGRQLTLRRNWKFNLLPGLILLLASALLIWDIVRTNVASTDWPWSLQLLPATAAASLVGVFGGLMFARAQYALSARPSLCWSAQPSNSLLLSGSAWTVVLFNAGPGVANILSVRYDAELNAANGAVTSAVGGHAKVLALFEAGGLKEGVDFHLELLTRDAPLPVVKSAKEGIEFAAFTKSALGRLTRLDFHVRVIDTVGDEHEKILPLMATVPARLTMVPLESADSVTTREIAMKTSQLEAPTTLDAEIKPGETIKNASLLELSKKALISESTEESDSFTAWTKSPVASTEEE